MKVLGIHLGHDSSAALIVDGKVVADVAEERFVRIKHYCDVPARSVAYCLKSQDLTIEDIDLVAVPTSSGVPDLNFLLDLKNGKQERQSRQRQVMAFVKEILTLNRAPVTKPPLYIKRFSLPSRTEIVHVEHHLAHASCAYYTSGMREKQLIVTIDGIGDGVSVGLWHGEDGKIQRLQTFGGSGSVGWFYGNATEALGWWRGAG